MKTKEILKAIFAWCMFLLFSPFFLTGALAYLIQQYVVGGFIAAKIFVEEF